MRPPPRPARASGEGGRWFVCSSLVMALDSFLVESCSPSSVVLLDGDRSDHALRLRPCEVDRQQPVLQVRAEHIHAVSEHEGALELPRGDAAMQVLPGLVVLLASADDELVFLSGYIELVAGKSRHRERDAQPFRLPIGAVA